MYAVQKSEYLYIYIFTDVHKSYITVIVFVLIKMPLGIILAVIFFCTSVIS